MSGKIRITLKRGQDESVFAGDDLPGGSEQPGFVAAPVAAPRKRKPKVTVRDEERDEPEEPPESEPGIATSNSAPAAPNDDSVHGIPYVRMLNRSSVVVAVPAHDVPARIHCGFQFIFGEPAVPRVLGNPDLCDKAGPGWTAFPRAGGNAIRKMSQAVSFWIRCMMDDRASRDEISKQVDWSWLDKHAPAMLSSMASMEP